MAHRSAAQFEIRRRGKAKVGDTKRNRGEEEEEEEEDDVPRTPPKVEGQDEEGQEIEE